MGTKTSTSHVSIVIVNYNGLAFIDDCLSSIVQNDHKNISLFMVDNASTDTSVQYVETHYPDVTIIRNKENYLFSKGANIGTQRALKDNPDYIFLLNPDITVTKTCISNLSLFLDDMPHVTACQPKLLFKGNPSYIQSCGIRCCLSGRAWDHRMGEKDGPHLPSSEEVLGVTGGAMFLRASMWNQENAFCETFGMYYEDVDLCLRHRRKGRSFYCVNTTSAYHVFSGIVEKEGSSKKYFYTERNCFLVVLRNFPFGEVLKSYFFSVPATMGLFCYNIFRGNFFRAWYCLLGTLKGSGLFIVYFPQLALKGFSHSKRAVFKDYIDNNRILPPKLRHP